MWKYILMTTALLWTTQAVLAQNDHPTVPSMAETSKLDVHIGGGPATPTGPTANYAGLGGSFQFGSGYKLDAHNSIVGEFYWQGLPTTRSAVLPLLPGLNPVGNNLNFRNNLYAVTAEYMFRVEGARIGYYLIGGGGWYYRHAQLENYRAVSGTVCGAYWDWWGFACIGGYVPTDNILATHGVSSAGVNGGIGFTIRLIDQGLKFYVEARYHYAPSNRVSTQLIPVTFGIRW